MSEELSERERLATVAIASVVGQLGLPIRSPRILRSENNVVAVASDLTVAKAIETPSGKALHKEAAVISALAGFDEAVGPSPLGIGPFEIKGWTVILLERLHEADDQPSAVDTHRSLARLHRAMAGLTLELVTWTDQLLRTAEAATSLSFDPEQQRIIDAAFDRLVSKALEYRGPSQVLHGDVWSGQLLKTTSGLRWIDFESASIGPKEWDLSASEVVDGYGPFDEDLWQTLRLVRSWTVAIWSRANSSHSPQLKWHVDYHLDRLHSALGL